MKNYYEELEVSKTASKEVIEKVYKVLAKKYHPDTTKEADKQAAEEKFKTISEAYETLSDDEKRKKYDVELEQTNPQISYEKYEALLQERDVLNNELNHLKGQFYQLKNQYTGTTTNANHPPRDNQQQNLNRMYQESNTNHQAPNSTNQSTRKANLLLYFYWSTSFCFCLLEIQDKTILIQSLFLLFSHPRYYPLFECIFTFLVVSIKTKSVYF